jgi:hypothetical protein
MIDVYLTDKEFAYDNIYQNVTKLPLDSNESTWLLFGALLVELDKYNYREITVYNSSRFVEEFNGQINFLSEYSKQTARDIHNNWKKKFLKLNIVKLDSSAVQEKINEKKQNL